MRNKGDLRLVELDSPYGIWEDPQAQRLFCEMVRLKLRGYLNEYDFGTLPIDTSDFIATHYLICRESAVGLEVLAGYRVLDWDRARQHGQIFGGLALAQAAGSDKHVRAVERIMERAKATHVPLVYAGSWTMQPEVRGDKELARAIRDLFAAVFVFSKEQNRAEVITGGTVRFKMDRTLAGWGLKPLTLDGEELECVHVPFLLGEQVKIMHFAEVSELARAAAKPWRAHWEQRLVISGAERDREPAADAA